MQAVSVEEVRKEAAVPPDPGAGVGWLCVGFLDAETESLRGDRSARRATANDET